MFCLCGAFNVFHGANALCHLLALFEADGLLSIVGQLAKCRWIVAQVELVADQNYWHFWNVLFHLKVYALHKVFFLMDMYQSIKQYLYVRTVYVFLFLFTSP